MPRSTDRTENEMIAKTDSLGIFSSLNGKTSSQMSLVFVFVRFVTNCAFLFLFVFLCDNSCLFLLKTSEMFFTIILIFSIIGILVIGVNFVLRTLHIIGDPDKNSANLSYLSQFGIFCLLIECTIYLWYFGKMTTKHKNNSNNSSRRKNDKAFQSSN